MSKIENICEKLKTHDLKFMSTAKNSEGYQEGVIMLTGESEHMQNMHGIVVETEYSYPNIGHSSYDHGPFYNHKIVISLGDIVRDLELVPKVRPEGFVSSTGIGAKKQFLDDIKLFTEKYAAQLTEPKMRRLDTKGGITLTADLNGSLFDLSSAQSVSEYKDEVVKRLSISRPILYKMLNSEVLANEFFDQIKEEMLELGCPYYTFKRPDDSAILKLLETTPEVEIRACGKAKEKKK